VGQAEKDFQSDDSTRKKPIYYDNISMMFLIKYNSNNVYVGGLDWTGLDWTGLDWTGLDWTGLDWTGLDWTGLDWIDLFIYFNNTINE
jgi:hypothetical protein